MARPKKNADPSPSPETVEATTETEQNANPESVTFIWNRAAKENVVVLKAARTRFTDNGPIQDPEHPPLRVRVKNGVYTTSDPEEIKRLQGHPSFNSKSRDGFSVKRELGIDEELEAIRKRRGMSKEALAATISGE